MEHPNNGRESSYVNAGSPFVIPAHRLDHDAQNNTEYQNIAVDDPSAYMSLKDNREPGSYYQSLRLPQQGADRQQARGGEHSIEYEI